MSNTPSDRMPPPHGAYALDEPEEYCHTCANTGEVEEMYGGRLRDKFSRMVPCPDCRREEHDTEPEEIDSGRLPDEDTTGPRDPSI